jgi:hypothetical protein
VNPDDQCEFTGTPPCGPGTSCLLALLSDAGTAKRCLAGACDLVDQDCDAGLKCAYLDGGRACVADGTLTEGQTCAGAPVGCKAGLSCTLLSNDGGSACSRFCRLDTDCGSPQRCYVTLIPDNSNERPLVCADPPLMCDPLKQDCPSGSDGCYPGSSDAGCYPAGTLKTGDDCSFSNDCAKGSACSGATPKCHTLCAFPNGSPSCPDAGLCTRLTSSQTVGVCL